MQTRDVFYFFEKKKIKIIMLCYNLLQAILAYVCLFHPVYPTTPTRFLSFQNVLQSRAAWIYINIK